MFRRLLTKHKDMFENKIVRCKSSLSALDMKRETAHQVIIKQGYLLRIPEASSKLTSLKRPMRKWFVFGSLNESNLFLDFYSSEDKVFAGVPEGTIDLKDSLCILSNQKHPGIDEEFVFAIVLKGKTVKLASNTRSSMQEWCATIERNLRKIGIIDSVGGENDYFLVQYRCKQKSPQMLPSIPLENPTSEYLNGELQNYNHEYEPNNNLFYERGPYLTMRCSKDYLPSEYVVHDSLGNLNPVKDQHKENTIYEHGQSSKYCTHIQINNRLTILPVAYDRRSLESCLDRNLSNIKPKTFFKSSINISNIKNSDEDEVDLNNIKDKTTERHNHLSDDTRAILYKVLCDELNSFSMLLTKKAYFDKNNEIVCSLIEKCTCVVKEIESQEVLDFVLQDPLDIQQLFNLVEFDGAVWVGKCDIKTLKKFNFNKNHIHAGDVLWAVNNCPVDKIRAIPPKIQQFSIKRIPLGTLVLAKHKFARKCSYVEDYFKDLGLCITPGTLQIQDLIPGGLLSRSGLTKLTQSKSKTCPWHITEINLEDVIFSPWHKVKDLLTTAPNSVISLTLQPSNLVKELMKE